MIIKAIIFDVDGTLIDSLDVMTEAAKKVAKEFNLRGDIEKVREMVGLKPENVIRQIFGLSDDKEIQNFKRRWSEEALIMLIDQGKGKLFPDTLKVMQTLKNKGYKIGLGSSLLRHMIENIAKAYGFFEYVDAYVGSDEVERGKPEPDTFLEVARRLNVSPNEAIVVGDTLYDIIAGLKGGFLTVLVDYYDRYNPKEIGKKPHYYIKSLSELMQILEETKN